MSPQFVDFDGDGHRDIVAGTYDGSPYVARGGEKGYAAPAMILDKKGERIVQNAFWNYDTKKWESTTRCNPPGDGGDGAHNTSAYAHDWDNDGDFDLLLGDYRGGRLVLRLNEGTNAKPEFAETNTVVEAGGKPLRVESGISTVRVCDWNGDGLPDLLIGSMGDCYGNAKGGGVEVYVNDGKREAPHFGAPITLIARDAKGAAEPTRPDSGLYMDLADFDGDGDLDLVVGGYSHWTPPSRTLDENEQARAEALKKELADLRSREQEFYRSLAEVTKGLKDKELEAKRAEWLKENADERGKLRAKVETAQGALEKLVPSPQRVSYTWVYERVAK